MMLSKTPASLDAALLARFAAIVGEKHAITDPQAQAPYLIEQRDLFHGHTPVVLRPGTVADCHTRRAWSPWYQPIRNALTVNDRAVVEAYSVISSPGSTLYCPA